MSKFSPVADARGVSRLVVDLTVLVTDVVETMHHNIAKRPGVLGPATLDPTRGITGFVYRSVRGVTRVVGRTIDAVLRPLEPLLAEAPVGPRRDAVLSVLNGVLGDHLDASGNPLAIPMQLRVRGMPLPLDRMGIARILPRPRQRIVVMVHGLCMSDAMWNWQKHDHGQSLARDLHADAVYLHYNSGRHISTNGAEFATLLERMVEAWPVPLRDLILVGHSMGGLVIRSACAAGEGLGHRWRRLLRGLVFLGTPHHGAPLERGGHGVDILFSASPYTVAFARLGQLRSAGITDLRHGSVLDRDWHGRERFGHAGYLRHAQPLPRDVPAFAIAGSLSRAAPTRGGKPRGDGLVPIASALGWHDDPDMAIGIDPARQWIAYGTGHLDLLCSSLVYKKMKGWLGGARVHPGTTPTERVGP
ncbi:MAG: esterase/lipase family protein [Candidatus Levyibacteriota bacterium]